MENAACLIASTNNGTFLTRLNRFLPLVVLMVLAVAKFYMTSDREIVAGDADSRTYIMSAQVGYWWTQYTGESFIRLPGYPLFLKLISFSGLPLRLVVEAFYILAVIYLATGLAAVLKRRWISPIAFLFGAFQPLGFVIFDYVLTETIAVISMLLVGGSLARLLIANRKHLSDIVVFCAAFAIWVISRHESPLVYSTLLLSGVVLLGRSWLAGDRTTSQFYHALRPFFTAALVVVISVWGIKTINYFATGMFATHEMEQPGYSALSKALLSVRQDHPQTHLPVPKSVRKAAYSVSPKFAELQSYIESNQAFGRVYSRQYGVKDDILGGMFYWTLRYGVFQRYHPKSARETDRYFQEMADEINGAIKSGRLPGRKSWSAFINANYGEWLPGVPHSMQRMISCIINARLDNGESESANGGIKHVFDVMANRRTAIVEKNTSQEILLEGWMAPPEGDLKCVLLKTKDNKVIAAATLLPRPDVQSFMLKTGRAVGEQMGFSFRVHDLNLEDLTGCYLTFFTEDGLVDAGLTLNHSQASLVWAPNQLKPEPNGVVDLCRFVPANPSVIPEWMPLLDKPILWLTLLALAYACWRLKYRDSSAVAVLLLGFFASTCLLARCGLYAVIDAAMWDADQPRYLFPTTPLFYALSAAIVAWSIFQLFSIRQREDPVQP